MEGGRIDNAVLKQYGEIAIGNGLNPINVASAYTIDVTKANVYNLCLIGNTTFTFTSGFVSGVYCSFTLFLQQGAIGGRTATWPASVKWPSGTAPTLTTAANRVDSLSFSTVDGGTTWYGALTGTAYLPVNNLNFFAWGANLSGDLGDNDTTIGRSSPVQLGGTNWTQLSSGYSHTAALRTDGTLWTWGANTAGQRGDNSASTVTKSSPVQVAGTNWAQLSAGANNTLALRTDGTLWSWGSGSQGALGDSTTVTKSSPIQIGGTAWAQVSTGNITSAAIRTDGTLWTWGNDTAVLGLNVAVIKSSPTQVGGTTWSQVSISLGSHIAAIRSDGTLWTWGYNTNGRLGDNTTKDKSSPVQVGGTNWAQVSAGGFQTAAIRSDGTLWAWGRANEGQLGNNVSATGVQNGSSSPVQVAGSNWVQVASARLHTAAIRSDGTLWVWGQNANGQIADLTTINRSSPVQVAGTKWAQVGGFYSNIIALGA